ncbi:hypothetical protein ACQP04_13055 [Pseudonocardia halophobica]|uniref:hypothetical protein n=1 Tax=Pseudonocardia halophobica TaxID=29401 RepID=UPI003D918A7E
MRGVTITDAAFNFNPTVSPHREDPHLFCRMARQGLPQLSPTLGAYMVTRYDDLVTVVDDPGTYSSAAAVPKIYGNRPEVVEVLRAGGVPETNAVANEDEPDHTPVRRVFRLPRRPDGPRGDPRRPRDPDQPPARDAARRTLRTHLHRELLLPRSGVPGRGVGDGRPS